MYLHYKITILKKTTSFYDVMNVRNFSQSIYDKIFFTMQEALKYKLELNKLLYHVNCKCK